MATRDGFDSVPEGAPLPRPEHLIDECERKLDTLQLGSDERRICSHLIVWSREALQGGRHDAAAVYMHWLGYAVGLAKGLRQRIDYRLRGMEELGDYLLEFRRHTEHEIQSDLVLKSVEARKESRRSEWWDSLPDEVNRQRSEHPDWPATRIYKAVGKTFGKKPAAVRDRLGKMGLRVPPRARP